MFFLLACVALTSSGSTGVYDIDTSSTFACTIEPVSPRELLLVYDEMPLLHGDDILDLFPAPAVAPQRAPSFDVVELGPEFRSALGHVADAQG